jgi:uncharacterized protein
MQPSLKIVSAGALAMAFSLISLPIAMAADKEKADKSASRQPAAASVSEEVTVKCGENTLAGVLHLPKTKAPHPAVIFIHGSGPMDRTRGGSYQPIWERFLEAGFACLSWDKPGIGASTTPGGRYRDQSFYQRASELRRALDFLKARRDIDPKRIGCWGISQAGWIMPMVASRTKDIAFMIAVSCPGQTGVEQQAYLLRCRALDQGETEETANQTAVFARLTNKLLPNPAPPEAFWKHLEGGNPEYVHAKQGPALDGSMLIDPAPLLERTACPVLAIFGTKDRIVDPDASAKVYERAFAKSEIRNLTIKMFPDADHGIMIKTPAAKDKKVQERSLAPGYLDAMVDWLKQLPAAKAPKE